MKNINEILVKNDIKKEIIKNYGDFIAKVNVDNLAFVNKARLVLVTATNPTPFGEGKTTISINLNDAINNTEYKSIACLREPSMGPLFGVKGGATGGGESILFPEDEINMHFTGDFHAIAAAANLISAVVDNHIYWGNQLKIDPNKIICKRAIDVSDRGLRDLDFKINKEIIYASSFDITAANEMMSIFCLSANKKDFLKRVNELVVAFNIDNEPITVEQLKISNAIFAIMKQALDPNAVQTKFNNLTFVHGGPFANISFGCSSVIATKLAMSKCDYAITEAGFGSDLGAEKFINILSREHNIPISCIVLVCTIRSLKYHGGVKMDNIEKENLIALENGFANLKQHAVHLQKYNIPFIIAINEFPKDTSDEKNKLVELIKTNNWQYAFNSGYANSAQGGMDLANKVITLTKDKNPTVANFLYQLNDTIQNKIKDICNKCYGITKITYSKDALQKIQTLASLKNYYICMSKTPSTFYSNLDSNNLPEIIINDFIVNYATKIIVVMTDKVFRMPGLPAKPKAEDFEIHE